MSEAAAKSHAAGPGHDCALCPRLVDFRMAQRAAHPDWHNAPVPSFGDVAARLLIVGLAPGLKGANRTGRPFTGDYAGDLLYATLKKFGFATGDYAQHKDDGLTLIDCRVSNAARCVPPENKPLPAEVATCRRFLIAEIAAMPKLRAILALGADRAWRGVWRRSDRRNRPSLSSTARCTRCPTASCSPTAITARATTPTPAG